MNAKRNAASLLLGVILAACAGIPSTSAPSGSSQSSPSPMVVAMPTPQPMATPTPSAIGRPTPTPSSTPTTRLLRDCPLPAGATRGWPVAGASEPVFGTAGVVFAVLRRDYWDETSYAIVHLDALGRVKPGWPICLLEPGGQVGLAVGGDGSLYATICQPEAGGCVLHRFTVEGDEPPGWPLPLEGMTSCAAPLVASDGIVYASCDVRSDDSHLLAGLTVAVDPNTGVRPGWPVDVGGQLEMAADGTLYVRAWSGYPDVSPLTVTALDPNGTLRPGWPRSWPADTFVRLAPDGTLTAWWYENRQGGEGGFVADRTFYALFGADGRTLPGWPRTTGEAASAPGIGPDGTLYYDSVDGDVFALDRRGVVKRGWPVRGVGGSDLAVSPPFVSTDGSILALDRSGVTALNPGGGRLWSWGPGRSGSLSRCLGATPCAERVDDPPVFEPDGTVYVRAYEWDADTGNSTAAIVALDERGNVRPGWPHRLPGGPTTPYVAPDGRLYLAGSKGLYALNSDGSRVK